MATVPASTRFSEGQALSRRGRAAVLALLLVVYAVIGLLVWAASLVETPFTPVHEPDLQAISVPLDPPPPPPPPASPVPPPEPAGDEGAAARRATPKPVTAPPVRIPNKAMSAAPVASTGNAAESGATSAGSGTGGAAAGLGTGSGGSGNGAGVGGSRAVKIAGDITATRDYPARTRNLRLGKSVIVVLTVGTDGRVHGCRIHQSSPDAEADAITCRLATERFRFRPATDRAGNPVASEFGWQQRWFTP